MEGTRNATVRQREATGVSTFTVSCLDTQAIVSIVLDGSTARHELERQGTGKVWRLPGTPKR